MKWYNKHYYDKNIEENVSHHMSIYDCLFLSSKITKNFTRGHQGNEIQPQTKNSGYKKLICQIYNERNIFNKWLFRPKVQS
jgi:hypothetical protein